MTDELPPDGDAEAQEREDWLREARQAAREERAWHRAQTERLRVYASLLSVTLPKIGATCRFEAGTVEIDPDVTTARHLAIEALFHDIRRICVGRWLMTDDR